MTVTRRLSDDELAALLYETGPMLPRQVVTKPSHLLFDMATELQEHRAAMATEDALRAERVQLQDENLGLREDLKKVVELDNLRVQGELRLNERLSSLETWLSVANPDLRLQERFDRLGGLIDGLNERIDKVADIIGERVSGLVDEIAAVRDSAKRAHERLGLIECSLGYPQPDPTFNGPGFPTGGASTVSAAAEAVLPVPQRGDRVRLDRAVCNNGMLITGWFDVIGSDAKWSHFQVNVPPDSIRKGPWLPWVSFTDPGLKEVRHADQR